MNTKVMQRLIWKDARTLTPLVIATLAGLVGLNLTVLVLDYMDAFDHNRWLFTRIIWFLVPNLLALGAPALLIGGEEESGALAWMRTLPSSWRACAASKLGVTTLCLCAAWLISTLLYWLQWNIAAETVVFWTRGEDVLGNTNGSGDTGLPLLTMWTHSVVLMLISFSMAYLFRSPINALIAVVPAMTAVTIFLLQIEETLFGQAFPPVTGPTTNFSYVSIVLAVLLLLFLVHQWAAKRRLTGPQSRLSQRLENGVSMEAFRPPAMPVSTWYGVSLSQRRPSVTGALLWQSVRQSGWALVPLAIAAMVGGTMSIFGRSPSDELASMIAGAALFVIAGLTWYGDSVRRRCVFLFDRGVSPTLIWRTRLFPTLSAVAIVTLVFALGWMVMDWRSREWLPLLTTIIIGYSLCQLVSQWSPRPALAFFVGPIFLVFALFWFMPLINRYHDAVWWAIWPSAPVLLFASWRLTPRWLAGSIDGAYNKRIAMYFALAAVLPYVLFIGGRWVTMPAAETKWRKETLAFTLPERPDASQPTMIVDAFPNERDLYDTDTLTQKRALVFKDETEDEFEQRLSAEIDAENSIGQFISFDELVVRMPTWPVSQDAARYRNLIKTDHYQKLREDELRIAGVLLKWSTKVRENARYGDSSFDQLTRIAEQADTIASSVLTERVYHDGMTAEIKDVVAKFPSDDLVLQSRRNSLIAYWRSDTDPFSVLTVMNIGPWDYLEELRRRRFVDQSVKFAEHGWHSGSMEDLRQSEFVGLSQEAGLWNEFSRLADYSLRGLITDLRQQAGIER